MVRWYVGEKISYFSRTALAPDLYLGSLPTTVQFVPRWSHDGLFIYAVSTIPTGGVFKSRISDLAFRAGGGLKEFHDSGLRLVGA